MTGWQTPRAWPLPQSPIQSERCVWRRKWSWLYISSQTIAGFKKNKNTQHISLPFLCVFWYGQQIAFSWRNRVKYWIFVFFKSTWHWVKLIWSGFLRRKNWQKANFFSLKNLMDLDRLAVHPNPKQVALSKYYQIFVQCVTHVLCYLCVQLFLKPFPLELNHANVQFQNILPLSWPPIV